jgi:hypothetical protein
LVEKDAGGQGRPRRAKQAAGVALDSGPALNLEEPVRIDLLQAELRQPT